MQVFSSEFSYEVALPKTAIFWIRDGVLIDRMAVNAVSFAFACLHSQGNGDASASLTDLVNFAFEQSGVSCAEKIERWNANHSPVIANVQKTAEFYNELASDAALSCQYFPGTKQLVEKTKELGCLNFITSAVEQKSLEGWAQSDQASHLLSSLTEILGRRSDEISKGRGHFDYVRKTYDIERIIYVADAVAEIADGRANSDEFGVVPIGFANLITPENVAEAFDVVLESYASGAKFPPGDLSNFTLHFDKLNLPDQEALQTLLKEAGADEVIGGPADDLMGNLNLFLARKLL